ncbi:acyltransferase [Phocaeicola barnesiae]
MNHNIVRILNRINRFFKELKSYVYSFLVFGSFKYFYIGKNASISGLKLNSIGKGCHLMDNSEIRGRVKIGNNVFIHENVLIRANMFSISIGDNTTINRNTNILSQVKIGANVSIAPNVVIIGANHVFADPNKTIKSQGSTSKGIVIEDDVWIATNSSILDGVTIGKGSVVAAGAVVNKDVPPYSVVGGVPAKILKSRLAN